MPRKSLVQLSLGLALVIAADLAGGPGFAQADEPLRCLTWDGRACDAQDLARPGAQQLLILSSGYSEDAADHFWRDLDVLIERMTGEEAGRSWSAQKRDKLLYVGYFTGGGPLSASSANFGARVIVDPGGRQTLAVQMSEVLAFVDALQVDLSWLLPAGAAVLVQSSDETAGASANAAPPSFLGGKYGVAVFSSEQVRAGSYTPVHELAHATLNFLDEYVEAGLETRSLDDVEALRERLVLDESWGSRSRPERSAWDLRLVEILAGNGPVNLSPYRTVSSVRTPGSKPERYEYEGGLFFGRGSYHDAGSNLMNSTPVRGTPRDDFAFDHSPAQQRVVDQLFGDAPYRPNDRLRNAGPVDDWVTTGSETEVLLYDGDKRNHFHRTQQYVVQVGWSERDAQSRRRWVTAYYSILPSDRTVELQLQGDGREQLLLLIACRGGMTELSTALNGREICASDAAPAFLPTLKFYVPYQNATVPTSQPFTTYYWRFRTDNGAQSSGWTGWSSFYRSF